MEVTYQLTQRDFFDSFVAHRNRSALMKWSMRVSVTLVLVLAGAGLILAATNRRSLSDFIPLFVLAILWAVVLWACPWWAARQFTKRPAVQGPRTVVLDAQGVHSKWNGGTADLEWRNFIRCAESRNQFLLYTSSVSFSILPKRSLTPEQISQLRELLAQNMAHS
jgi:hypothetical protein